MSEVREEIKHEQMVRPMIKDATGHLLGSNFLRWRIILNGILLSAFILFAVGIFAPILTFERFFIFANQVSIITGLFQLLSEGHFILFGVIFLFSIVFPFLKMLFLCRVCNGDIGNISKHEKLIDWIAKYGKWSMLDVFVAAVLIVTVKLGAVANIEVHFGLYAFAGSVILTMFVTWKIFSLTNTVMLLDSQK